jgi:hypothetical protein
MRNGVRLIEAVSDSGASTEGSAIIDCQYTVMSIRLPGPLYQGPSLQAAQMAFDQAAK